MNYLHLMKKVALLCVVLSCALNAQDSRFAFKGTAPASGGTFVWNKSGEEQKQDSIRYIEGSNITLTQSGNTLTIAGAAGAGSTASVRANVGWTSNGTTAQDTLATYYLINGKFQRQMWVDTDNDSIIVAPHALYPLMYKDATSNLWFVDSTGIMSAQAAAIVPATGYITIGGTNALNRPAGGNAVYVGPGFSFAGIGSQVGLGAYFNSNTTGRWQGIATVRAGAVTADTQLVVRNDWNSTLDSTFMVFANGSAYVGGNNIYFGANRIRSVTGDTAFVFYAGSTQAFAILADGSTADLVAGTPPSFRGIPPMEYRILLWMIAILLLILVAWKVFELVAKIKLNRYDTHVEQA